MKSPPTLLVFRVCCEQKLHSTTVCEAWIFNASLFLYTFHACFPHRMHPLLPRIKPRRHRENFFHLLNSLFSTSSSNDFKICGFKRYNDDFSFFHASRLIAYWKYWKNSQKKNVLCVQWRMKIESWVVVSINLKKSHIC